MAVLVALIGGGAVAMPAAATDRVVVVHRGDTLSEIALAHGLTVAQLQALNNISDPNRIYPGQRLRLSATPPAPPAPSQPAAKPTAVVHVVQSGEHLTGIARRYGSTITAIAGVNGIANPSFLRVGQRLIIPGTAAPAPAAKPSSAPAAPAATPLVHIVAPGETLTGIARRYATSITAIARANGIAKPSYLRVGQRLAIPGPTSAAPVAKAAIPPTMAGAVAARGEIRAIITAEARAQGVPMAFALAVAWQESGWQARVVSRAGAVGVMQLTPATAQWVGATMLGERVRLRDLRSNVRAGVRLLRHYLDRYHGDKALVLAAYYQGQTAADRRGIYRMSRPYIASILRLESFFAK
ncbi:MAG: LysM peptidoglycan-binding domain-containing protein [Chloroflexota bacterium]